jgi:hypothetical protein
MKYCVPYSKNFKYNSEIDEVIVHFDREHNSDIFVHILKSPENFKDKRYIFFILDFDYFEEYKFYESISLLKNKINFALMFVNYSSDKEEVLNILRDNQIPFFFETRVKDWDTLHGLIDLGISDVYIVEEMGFQLNQIVKYTKPANIQIRTFANVAQTAWKQSNSLKSFFIRPEDVKYYENYIDVIEFFAKETNQYEVLYKIYAKDRKWFGELKELIIGFNQDLDSRNLPSEIFIPRISCGKKCIKGEKCSICDLAMDLSNTFKKEKIYIKTK